MNISYALFAPCGVFVLIAAGLGVWPIDLPATQPSGGPVRGFPLQEAAGLAPPDWSLLPTRSLFRAVPPQPTASREGAPTASAPPASPLPDEKALRLVGIIDDATTATAFVEIAGQREIRRSKIGETIESWLVVAIGRRSITLIRPDKTVTLTLDPQRLP